MLYFDNAEVKINGSGLIADSISISTQNNIQPVPTLGYKAFSRYTSNGFVTSSINISYLVEPSNEPALSIVNFIKTGENDFHWMPDIVEFAGITGSGYLESYSFRVTPNDQVRATVGFQCFHPLSGTGLAYSKSTRNIQFSGLADGWLSSLASPTTEFRFPVYDVVYNFRAGWTPVYAINNKTPIQVQFDTAEENISIVWDNFRHISFSGSNFTGEINQMTGINLQLYRQNDTININMSGAKLINTQINGAVDDIVRVSLSANKFF